MNENVIESTSALGPEWVRDESKTLFAQVMENAKEIAYDANIGRYLHKAVAAQMEDKEKLHELRTILEVSKIMGFSNETYRRKMNKIFE